MESVEGVICLALRAVVAINHLYVVVGNQNSCLFEALALQVFHITGCIAFGHAACQYDAVIRGRWSGNLSILCYSRSLFSLVGRSGLHQLRFISREQQLVAFYRSYLLRHDAGEHPRVNLALLDSRTSEWSRDGEEGDEGDAGCCHVAQPALLDADELGLFLFFLFFCDEYRIVGWSCRNFCLVFNWLFLLGKIYSHCHVLILVLLFCVVDLCDRKHVETAQTIEVGSKNACLAWLETDVAILVEEEHTDIFYFEFTFVFQ